MNIAPRLGLAMGLTIIPLLASAQTANTDASTKRHGSPERHAAMVACRPIIRSQCQGIEKKGSRTWACLASSEQPLPADCRQALSAFAKSKPVAR